jgi:hypothetical protein
MQHIGLGRAAIEAIEIVWPSSRTPQILTGVPVNAFLEVTEGKPFVVKERKAFKLKGGGATHQH